MITLLIFLFLRYFTKVTLLAELQNPLENIKSLQLSPSILEELVQKHYIENKKIISLEGNLLRLSLNNNISRDEIIKFYVGNEINPKLKDFLNTNENL